MLAMPKGLCPKVHPQDPHAPAHGRAPVRVLKVREEVYVEVVSSGGQERSTQPRDYTDAAVSRLTRASPPSCSSHSKHMQSASCGGGVRRRTVASRSSRLGKKAKGSTASSRASAMLMIERKKSARRAKLMIAAAMFDGGRPATAAAAVAASTPPCYARPAFRQPPTCRAGRVRTGEGGGARVLRWGPTTRWPAPAAVMPPMPRMVASTWI